MATPSYGANVWVGIGEESTWGTAVSRTKFLEIVSSSLKVERNYAFSRVTRGLDPQRKYASLEIARGDLVTELMYEGYLKLFKHLLGSSSTTELTTGQSYRHEFMRATQLPTGLTIEQETDQQNFLFTGCRINQATFRFTLTEYPQATWSIAAKTGTDNTGSESTPTFPSDLPILPQDGGVTLGAINYSEYVQSVEITIGNALDVERRMMGSVNPKQQVRSSTRPDISIKLEMEHNDVTKQLVTDMLAGNTKAFKLTYTSDDDIGSSSDKYKLMIEAPNCVVADAFPTVNDPGILPLSIELRPMIADSDEFMTDTEDGAIKVTVQNGESTV